MEFNLSKTIEVLERTPLAIEQMLSGLSDEWTMSNEGPDTWSPFIVVGHLVNCEKTNWVPRMEAILAPTGDHKFPAFDRFLQLQTDKDKTLRQLLDEFKQLRKKNIDILKSKKLTEQDLAKTGIHPEFGTVMLSQLLATWAGHDLAHIAQIIRVMAKQYKTAVGPWTNYLSIMKK